jgi:predicted SAM-dependent methyltransferase
LIKVKGDAAHLLKIAHTVEQRPAMWKKWIRLKVYAPLRRIGSRREIARYIAGSQHRRINLGCGKNFPEGWLNVDLFPHFGATYMNAAAAWPVPEGTFEACLCEHVIEHVPKPVGRAALRQAYRALAPGGVIRLVTPNMQFFAELILGKRTRDDEALYSDGLEKLLGVNAPSRCDMVNMIFYEHGHRYIFSPDELSEMLSSAGFVDLVRTRAGEPHDPIFAGTEGHANVVDHAYNAMEAFAIEGRKPGSRRRPEVQAVRTPEFA